jgi:ubiquinone/menaquinone biosynthesis C-methylase UbiE
VSWLLSPLYDAFMRPAEEACLREWRGALLSAARGEVVEIGAGTGANLESYPATVDRLVLVEPDRGMADRLRRRTRAEILHARAEALPLPSASFDVVVSTLVLCTVDDPARALREARRILRPGGRLLFLEHVAAEPRSARAAAQRLVEPVWRRLAGGCHLTRPTDRTIAENGFRVVDLSRASIRRSLPIVRPSVRGVAVAG